MLQRNLWLYKRDFYSGPHLSLPVSVSVFLCIFCRECVAQQQKEKEKGGILNIESNIYVIVDCPVPAPTILILLPQT